MPLHFALSPLGLPPEDPSHPYANLALRVVVAQDLDPYWQLVGEGRNAHGDRSPLFGSAMRDGEGFRVSLLSTLDTSHEAPYRGYYILSITLHLRGNLEGWAYVGNVDVDMVGSNDYSVHRVHPISEHTWTNFGEPNQ